jgi:hypothetical protein
MPESATVRVCPGRAAAEGIFCPQTRMTLGGEARRSTRTGPGVGEGGSVGWVRGRALTGPRKSLPTLAMVSRDLTRVLKERYQAEYATETYLEQPATW